MEFNIKPKVVHRAQNVLKVKHLIIYNVIIGAVPESISRNEEIINLQSYKANADTSRDNKKQKTADLFSTKRIQLHFIDKVTWIRSHIFEDVIVSFFPYYPN